MKDATYPEWQHKPVRLTEAEIDDPLQLIIQFFSDRSLPDHRTMVWKLAEATLSGAESGSISGTEAACLVKYVRRLECFIEAVAVLMGNRRDAVPE